MPRGRPRRDKFLDLPEEWRNAMAETATEKLNSTLTEVVSNEEENQKNKEEDQDLASCKEAYQTAAAGYKEATRLNKLKMRYIVRVLSDRGVL